MNDERTETEIPTLRIGDYISYDTVYRNARGRILSRTPKRWKGEMTSRKLLNALKRMDEWIIFEGGIEVGLRNRPWPLGDDERDEAMRFLFDPDWTDIQWPKSILHELVPSSEMETRED